MKPWRYQWLDAALSSAHALGEGERMMVLALNVYMNDAGTCWPSQETLAGICGVSSRTIRRRLEVLERNGWIKRNRRRRSSTICQASMVLTGQPVSDQAGILDRTKEGLDRTQLWPRNNHVQNNH